MQVSGITVPVFEQINHVTATCSDLRDYIDILVVFV